MSRDTRSPKQPKVWVVDPNCVRGWVGKLGPEAGLAPSGEGRWRRSAAIAEGERSAAHRAGDFKKSGAVLREGAAVKFAFIKEQLSGFAVDVCCGVLEVSRSGYYAWFEPAAQRAGLAAGGAGGEDPARA